jgi:hypothetical protein
VELDVALAVLLDEVRAKLVDATEEVVGLNDVVRVVDDFVLMLELVVEVEVEVEVGVAEEVEVG